MMVHGMCRHLLFVLVDDSYPQFNDPALSYPILSQDKSEFRFDCSIPYQTAVQGQGKCKKILLFPTFIPHL